MLRLPTLLMFWAFPLTCISLHEEGKTTFYDTFFIIKR